MSTDIETPEANAEGTRRKPAKAAKAPRKAPRKRRTKPAAEANRPAEPVTAAPPAPAHAATESSEAPTPRSLVRVPMPVRWRDLDAFNHVNNSKYLSFLEEARLQWMLTLPGMGMDDRVAPVVAAAHLNYRRPIAWPAQVEIELFVERLGNSSLTIGHRIVAGDDASVLYCDGNVVMVWIDRQTGEAAPLPDAVRGALA